MSILNLTQHPATPDQVAAGVVDLPAERREFLVKLLTFEELPSRYEIEEVALHIAALCDTEWVTTAMIGGAPYLMSALEEALSTIYVKPVYAFSKRESVEELQPDGSVRKATVFKHLGFVTNA